MIVERPGRTPPENLEKLRHGRSPTMRCGAYAGELLSVEPLFPRSIAPGLDKMAVKLELMRLGQNMGKGSKVGDRQGAISRHLHKARLLSGDGLGRRLAAAGRGRVPG
jgi:hypothetical protein